MANKVLTEQQRQTKTEREKQIEMVAENQKPKRKTPGKPTLNYANQIHFRFVSYLIA